MLSNYRMVLSVQNIAEMDEKLLRVGGYDDN